MRHIVQSGIDNIASVDQHLRGKRIGLITSPSGIDKHGKTTIDILHSRYTLTALYSPEHGVRGDAQAGDAIDTYVDSATGITAHSMYGENKHLTPEMVAEIDVMVFDIQDCGARFYTYLYTLAYAMQGCKRYGIPMVVLDRINPIGGDLVEGTMLDEAFHSFVGEYAIPTRYALTIGEYAAWINKEKNIGCELTISPITGWERKLYADQTDLPWVTPSPNIATVDGALLYIGSCIFEGTNLSEGRGTTQPFHLVGAPWVDSTSLAACMNDKHLPGLMVRPTCFTPMFSKHQGILCHGVQLHVTDRSLCRPFAAGLHLLESTQELHPKDFTFTDAGKLGGHTHLDHLLGTDAYRLGTADASTLIAKHTPLVDHFAKTSQAYHLYR